MCPSCAPASQTWSSSLTLLLPGDLMISMVCDANFAHTRARHCSPRVGSCDGSCYAETSSLTPHAPLRNALTSKRNYRNALSHTHVQTRSTTRVSSTTCALRCWGPRRSSSRRSLAGSLSRRVTSTYSSSFPASFPHGSRARAVHVELFWGGGGPFLANSTHRRVIPQTHLLHRSPRHPHAISTPSPRHLRSSAQVLSNHQTVDEVLVRIRKPQVPKKSVFLSLPQCRTPTSAICQSWRCIRVSFFCSDNWKRTRTQETHAHTGVSRCTLFGVFFFLSERRPLFS